jgi:O-antigen ligase
MSALRAAPILASVALVPLIVTPGLLFYYDVTPKVAILLLGVSFALLFGRTDFSLIKNHRASRWFAGILGFQWLWFGLAAAVSTNSATSLNGSTWRRLGLVTQTGVLVFSILCLAWLLENPANIRLLRSAIAATGLLISVYTIAQYFGIDPLLPAKAYQAGEGGFTIVRPPGTLGHADYLAAWLLFALFCSSRWIAPVAIFALLLTGTRAALLGLVAGAIVLWLMHRRAPTVREGYGAAILAVLIGIFVITPAGGKLRARVHWSLDDTRGGARLLLWRDTLPIVARHPLTGLGPETFGTQFPLHESRDLARAYPDFYHESPHNLLLDLAAGEGIPAAIAFLGLCGLAAWVGVRSGSQWAPGLLAALTALFIAHLFVVFTLPTELAFYLVIAMLISLESTSGASHAIVGWSRLAGYAVAAVLLVFTVRSVAADYWLARAHDGIADEDIPGATAAYRASLWWQARGTGADLPYSREMANLASQSPIFKTRLNAFQQALESGVRATEESEQRQNAWFNLAELFAAQNDAANAEHSLRNAIAWSPNWFKPHWILAQLLETERRMPEALAEAQAALDRDGGHDPEVSQTWERIRSAPGNH